MKQLKPLVLSGRSVLPLIEGGKGISVTNGASAGAWAAAGGVGTFSSVFGDLYDENGNLIPLIFNGKTRKERHDELIEYAIKAGVCQAKIAHDVSGGNGCIHMNILWGISSVEAILHGVLEQTKGLVHGVTCGAGMPFKLAEIAANYGVYYYPIVSSSRAFNLLWLRAYKKHREWLGGVVYEDPWKAGGHNGISNKEDPEVAESPYERVRMLRETLSQHGMADVPIIMAGGVWFLREWSDWIDNSALGPIAFQFGTRPLLTVESPIPSTWKNKLLDMHEGDVILNHFSPTGFYSSSFNNAFLQNLQNLSQRQIKVYADEEGGPEGMAPRTTLSMGGARERYAYIDLSDLDRATGWIADGYSKIVRTPDATIVFMTPSEFEKIRSDQLHCGGCLTYCRFSNWSENGEISKDRIPDPRSYCIRKTLYNVAHSGDVDNELVFAGHTAYLFGQDPFYANGFIPTVKQLIDRILSGD